MNNLNKLTRLQRFMTVTVTVTPIGVNLSCWMSTEEFWKWDLSKYPHQYVYSGDDAGWHIRSDVEITSKVVSVVGEYAETILREQIERNYKRKVGNLGKYKNKEYKS